jgi:hypothetical protein
MGKLSFTGSLTADLFTRQIAESFQDVLDRNMRSNPDDPMLGFASAFINRQSWPDTMWTRDAGTFLREQVQ